MLLVVVLMVWVVMLVMVVVEEFCRGCGEQGFSEMKLPTTACLVHMQRYEMMFGSKGASEDATSARSA